MFAAGLGGLCPGVVAQRSSKYYRIGPSSPVIPLILLHFLISSSLSALDALEVLTRSSLANDRF